MTKSHSHFWGINYQIMQNLLLAAGMVLSLFLWEGHQGFDLWDEGFLWYGAQRVLVGEVPIRDFMSYDPGRYYWVATFMRLWGDNGILALRGAAAIFQVFGLLIGLALLCSYSKKQSFLFMLISALTLVVWMSPLYKLFDVSLSIALLAGLAFLAQQPTLRRYFTLGVIIGFIAFFGKNHGIYGLGASLCVMVYCAIKNQNGFDTHRSFAIWSVGVLVGYLPILVMFAIIPGFAQAFWESIQFLFEIQATNLPLPVPWPWNVSFAQLPAVEVVRGWTLGAGFIAIVVFGVLAIVWVIRQGYYKKSVSPILVSSAFLALPYAHYAYSRADTLHLAMGIFPFLIGSLALLMNQRPIIKWPFTLLLCAASLMVMAPLHPGWMCYTSQQCIDADVGGSKLKTHKNVPIELSLLEKLTKDYAPNNQSFIVTPFWPGAYAAMNRKSPMWEIYALFPRGEAFQQAEIERIKAADIGFAMIINIPLDGREDLRFSNSHPLIDTYIHDHFERLDGYTHDSAFQLYVNKQASR